MNRGLIEASVSVEAAAETATLPRFMNRGLIEAIVDCESSCLHSLTSPIHESGPH